MAKSYPHITTEHIANLYENARMSLPQIGEATGMTPQSVYERLKKNGVTLRPLGEAIHNSYMTGRSKSQKGPLNPNWKGGFWIDKDGYRQLITDRKHRPEHRVVWEKHYGEIPDGWVVHHLNGVRDDNRIENLHAMPRKRHSPITAMEPYQQRIRDLELQVYQLRKLT